jgi:UDP-N-acetylmuramoyl-L-alanyl-D-glutamate--2,6-diaminopimelate ligase
MTDSVWTLQDTAAAVLDARVVPGIGTDIALQRIATDSRTCKPGDLFVALPGTQTDGSEFASDAIQNGAVAILTSVKIDGIDVPQIVTSDVRRALAEIAASWYGSPSEDVQLVGITGTNGKTTTVGLVATIGLVAGTSASTIGTLGVTLNGEDVPVEISRPTTPEAHELRQTLGMLTQRGAKVVAMEVSSHALVLDRVYGLDFDVAVFTNLTPDHLDFHGNIDSYFDAKVRLFLDLSDDAFAVINIDDEHGRKLSTMSRGQVVTYGWDDDADIRPIDITTIPSISGRVATPVGEIALDMPLVGRFNVENSMAAIGAAIGLGLSTEQIENGLSAARALPGRFEPIVAGQDFAVIVDYAHTPDALENVLTEARHLASGKVICVVGCGGDRDRAKRPVMGEISTRLADSTVFTSDNPRTENPELILDDIIAGARSGNQFDRIEKRGAAIRSAVSHARPGDVVVIAGKGHEPYQEIGHTKHPYDDRDEARMALAETTSSNSEQVRR